MTRQFLPILLALTATTGCLEGTSTDSLGLGPTLVEIRPENFLEGLPCLVPGPGGSSAAFADNPVSYRVSLVQQSAPPSNGTGGSDGDGGSDAVAGGVVQTVEANCNQGVAFKAEAGAQYSVSVELFARGDAAEPAWSTCCACDGSLSPPVGTSAPVDGSADSAGAGGPGYGGPYVTAQAGQRVFVRPCKPLTWLQSQPTDDGAASVSGAAATSPSLMCQGATPQAGGVADFEAAEMGASFTGPRAACGDVQVFSDLAAGSEIQLKMLGYDADTPAMPRWFTTCARTVAAAMTLPVSCDPFRTDGVYIDLKGVNAAAPGACGGEGPDAQPTVGVTFYAQASATPLDVAPLGRSTCDTALFFSRDVPGAVTVCLENPVTQGITACTGSLTLGQVTELAPENCAAAETCP